MNSTKLNRWDQDLPSMVAAVRADPPHIGVLSMGERCAVALILDTENLLDPDGEGGQIPTRPRGYTWLDCVNRIEDDLLQACIRVQRQMS